MIYHQIVRNVDEALKQGLNALDMYGVEMPSRNGPTLEYPGLFVTDYVQPWNRVIQTSDRGENPFFHLMEALWMLAGRNDVNFLAQFLPKIAQFSDDGRVFHGAYGYRLRRRFGIDQLKAAIDRLRAEPTSRQVVLQMWDARIDLNASSKDIPCNDFIMLRTRHNKLDMTVFNRSNDAIWGAFGANVVHFSFIHEYIACMTGIRMGTYSHVSHCMHVYTELPAWHRLKDKTEWEYRNGRYESTFWPPFMASNGQWNKELDVFMRDRDTEMEYEEPFFDHLVIPAYLAWENRDRSCLHDVANPDWKAAFLNYADRNDWR